LHANNSQIKVSNHSQWKDKALQPFHEHEFKHNYYTKGSVEIGSDCGAVTIFKQEDKNVNNNFTTKVNL